MFRGIPKLSDTVKLTYLWRLVYGFNVYSDTLGVVGVFRVVSIEEGKPLLHEATLLPMANETRNFPKVHEGHEVEMAVGLALEHDCWWQALVAHAEREGLVVGAVVVDFVAVGLDGRARLTALVGSVGALTLLLPLKQVVLKGLMFALDKCLCFRTVGALLAHGMVALVLDQLRSLLSHIQAVHTLPIGAVSAVAFLYLIVGERVLVVCW
jgi:hypothetical protein